MDEELIVCSKCERPTCTPPDDLIEFTGLCPGCVIRQEVLPIIPGRFADLVESILDCRDDALMAGIVEKMGGVAIVVNASDALDADDMTERVMEVFKHIILNDEDARAKLKEVIEAIDKNPPARGGKVKKPVVRNDPRTG